MQGTKGTIVGAIIGAAAQTVAKAIIRKLKGTKGEPATGQSEAIHFNVTTYGRALATVLRAFVILESEASWFERPLIQVLRGLYRHRLKGLMDGQPDDVVDAMLSE